MSIIQVVDRFEYYTNAAGKKRLSKRAAIQKILANADTIYGEGAYLLAKFIAPYGIGDSVRLSDGKTGVVIEQTSDSLSPIVKLDISGKVVDLSRKSTIKIID